MSYAARLLVESGLVSKDQIREAASRQAIAGGTIGRFLVESGVISDQDLVSFLVRRFPGSYVPRNLLKNISLEVIETIPSDMAAEFRILPLELYENNLTLAMADPSDSHAIEEVAFYTGSFVNPAIVSETDMTWALEKYYGISDELPSEEHEREPVSKPQQPVELKVKPEGSSVDTGIRLKLKKVQVARVVEEVSNLVPAQKSPEERPAQQQEEEARSPIELKSKKEPDAIPLVQKKKPASEAKPKDKTGTSPVQPARTVVVGDEKPAGALGKAPESRDQHAQSSTYHKTLAPSEKSTIKEALADRIPGLKTAKQNGNKTAKAGNAAAAVQSAPSKVIRKDVIPVESTPEQSEPAMTDQDREKKRKELMETIKTGRDIDELVEKVFDIFALYCRRSLFFLAKRGEIRGRSGRYADMDKNAVRTIVIDRESPSMIRRTCDAGAPYYGPASTETADRMIYKTLGSETEKVMIIPLKVGKRTAGVFYLDNLFEKLKPPLSQTIAAVEAAGDAMARLIYSRKQSGPA